MANKPKIEPRKPPAVDPSAAARFVAGKEAPGSDARRRTVVTRRDGRELKRLTVYLPVELARRLAVRCAESGREMSDAIGEAVNAWLRGA